MELNKNTIIGDILDFDATSEQIFLSKDMPCVDCPAARGETLEEACNIHGVEFPELLLLLKEHLDRR